MFQRQGNIIVSRKTETTEAKIEDEIEELVSKAFDNGAIDFKESEETKGGHLTIHVTRSFVIFEVYC